MATTEGEFKSEFKKDLDEHYPRSLVWTNTDLLRSGLPDFSILFDGVFIAVEAKFIKKLPKKKTSLTLSHTVSATQQKFLKDAKAAGGVGIVLVGSSQSAVVFEEIKENYTLEEVLKARRIDKVNGKWQLKGFLDEWQK